MASRTIDRVVNFAAAAAMLALTAVTVQAQSSPSPYDMKFALRGQPAAGAPMYAAMSEGSKVVMTIPGATTGIVLRWCRPELPFGPWQFGSLMAQRQILDAAWCEISVGGRVGNVQGKVLDPMR